MISEGVIIYGFKAKHDLAGYEQILRKAKTGDVDNVLDYLADNLTFGMRFAEISKFQKTLLRNWGSNDSFYPLFDAQWGEEESLRPWILYGLDESGIYYKNGPDVYFLDVVEDDCPINAAVRMIPSHMMRQAMRNPSARLNSLLATEQYEPLDKQSAIYNQYLVPVDARVVTASPHDLVNIIDEIMKPEIVTNRLMQQGMDNVHDVVSEYAETTPLGKENLVAPCVDDRPHTFIITRK